MLYRRKEIRRGQLMEYVRSSETGIIKTDVDESTLRSMIYTIQERQIMLDSDLAALYQVETKVLNQAVKRNIERFPERFCFKLNQDEFDHLRSQSVTSNGQGGRRYIPYAFTEQGIAMLSSVLKSDIAIQISIRIMDTFVEMRKLGVNNSLLTHRMDKVEVQQLEYQKNTNEKFNKVFEYISAHEETKQTVFFDGQIYDAFSLLVSLVKTANYNIVLIDNYVDIDTLNILAKRKDGVKIHIYTEKHSKLTTTDISNFNKQYPCLIVKHVSSFHDRFLILDMKIMYHIGASVKDVGKKCFGINQIQESDVINSIIKKIEL